MTRSLPILLAALFLGCASAEPPPKAPPPAKRPAQSAKPERKSAPPLAGGSSDGMTCEQAIDQNVDQVAIGKKGEKDLNSEELGAVLNTGSYLGECDVPETTKVDVCTAVQNGRAIGVTVATSPQDSALETCVAGKIRALGFPIHPKMDVVRTRF